MMTMVMLGRLWCGGDDGSGYDIVGMVVMRCDEDGGGGMMKVAAGCGVRRRVEARGELEVVRTNGYKGLFGHQKSEEKNITKSGLGAVWTGPFDGQLGHRSAKACDKSPTWPNEAE
ncbi:hypothetical protein Tco_1015305 [Tanacetum coccineum]|uniref:Uncharacterized protein n=1 Tax=Tanacetum coccineum TaxID=301880 RepID=A0ABQ5FLK9_9ASTR